jgi:penicillin-binding protein 2
MPVYNQSRSRIIQVIFILVFLLIVLQLLNLQIFSTEYKLQAENNAIYRKVIYPDRGVVYDRRGKSVLENTIMYDLMVTPSEARGTDTAAICGILGIDTAEFRKRIVTAIIKNSRYKPSIFEQLITDEVFAKLNENMYKFPGFNIVERPVRAYPFHAAAHVLGYLGEVDSSFLKRHAGEGYEPGDYAGMTGLERGYENILMGQRGVKRFIRDNKNRIQGSYNNGIFDTAAVAGRNLYSSLDIDLQLLAEKLLQHKIGSVVAINPKTGGILAMATAPSYDPTMLTGAQRRKNFGKLILDTARPLLKPCNKRPISTGFYL